MIKESTTTSFNDDISSGLVLVDFWATWCSNCRMEMPFIEKLDKERGGKVQIIKVNAETETELAQKFNIQTLPTLIYFKDGKEVQKTVGFRPYAKLLADVDNFS